MVLDPEERGAQTRGAGGRMGGGFGGFGGRRLTTETRPAWRTTEFLAYVVTFAGILIASAVVGGDNDDDFFRADRAWLYITILTFGYMVGRGLAKSGSRERYWDEGDQGGGSGGGGGMSGGAGAR